LLILLDLRPANILLKLANLDHLTEDELLSLPGQPEESEVLTESGEDPPLSAPKYLVASANLSRLGAEYLMEQICLISGSLRIISLQRLLLKAGDLSD
jgi:serine/threonine-protein kinase SRPK3